MTGAAEEARALVERLADILGRAAYDELGQVIAPDYVQHQPGVPQGLAGVVAFFEASAGAFADVRSWTEHVVADDAGNVAGWMCMEGTHVGPFMGVEATGRRITLRTADWFRVEGGRLVEHWAFWDPTDYLAQMGALPADLPLPASPGG